MKLNQLESAIKSNINEVIDHFSISIKTKEGNITINAHEPRRAAGIAKIPILIEAYHRIENGLLQADTLVYIESDMKTGGTGVINHLTNSNVYSYKNLLELMIIVSDNTAANLILDKIDIGNVNQLADRLGCTQTKLERSFMDTAAIAQGLDNYTSAEDMTTFLTMIDRPNDFIHEESRKQILDILHHQQFRYKLPSYLNETDEIDFFHKTGELPGIEHDVAIIKSKGETIYAAILTQDWENNGVGKQYIANIGKYLIEYLQSNTSNTDEKN